MSLGDVTQTPVLALLGFWWGQLARRGSPIDKSFSLGLLACVGSAIAGLGVWFQFWLIKLPNHGFIFNSWSVHTLLAQIIITGLIAPLICSWMLLLFRKNLIQ